jgi:hypothetical protein
VAGYDCLMDWSLYYIQLNATVTWLIEVAALVHLVFFFFSIRGSFA